MLERVVNKNLALYKVCGSIPLMAILLENYIFEEIKVKGQTHYSLWKLKISLILMQEDLWEIMEPSVV